MDIDIELFQILNLMDLLIQYLRGTKTGESIRSGKDATTNLFSKIY